MIQADSADSLTLKSVCFKAGMHSTHKSHSITNLDDKFIEVLRLSSPSVHHCVEVKPSEVPENEP